MSSSGWLLGGRTAAQLKCVLGLHGVLMRRDYTQRNLDGTDLPGHLKFIEKVPWVLH